MKTLKFAAAAIVCIGLAGSALAGEGYCGRGGYGHWGHGYEMAKKHGVPFDHGFFYIGIGHKHFTEKWHNPWYKTDFFWDPYTHMPYFFCAGHGVYYPVSYIREVGPTAKGPGPFKMEGGKAMFNGAAVPFLAEPVGGGTGVVGGAGGAGGAGVVAPKDGAGAVAPAPAPGGAGGAPAGDKAGAAAGQPVAKVAAKPAVSETTPDLPKGTFDDAIPDDVK